jgi:hypothetical protein
VPRCRNDGGMASSRRELLWYWAAFAPFFTACADPSPPVHFVPFDAAAAGDPLELAAQSIERCGFTIALRDVAGRRIASEWRHDASLVGPRRRRIEIRIQGDAPPGFALAVPIQVQNGERWTFAGEDDDLRRQVIGNLLARMQSRR